MTHVPDRPQFFAARVGYATGWRITIRGCRNKLLNRSIFVYIDPSGNVNTLRGNRPIENATVTLWHSEISGGPFEQLANGSGLMSPENRRNPDRTDASGHFGWDVVAGFYKVRARKQGCHKPGDPHTAFNESGVVQIPPAVLDLDIRLDCVLALPVYKRCSRTRRVVLRAQRAKLRRITIAVDGVKRTLSQRRIRSKTTIRLRDRGRDRRVRVKVVGRTTAGTILRTTETYRLCS